MQQKKDKDDFYFRKAWIGFRKGMQVTVFILVLTIAVVSIEFFILYPTEKSIEDVSKKVGFIEGVINRNEYYELLYNIQLGSGLNLEAEREKIDLDRTGAYSITMNQKLQQTIVASCENTNRASNYTGMLINCSEVDSWGGFPNQEEIHKIGDAGFKLYDVISGLETKKEGLKSKKDIWSGTKNLLYVFLAIFSVIGMFPKHFLNKNRKTHRNEE